MTEKLEEAILAIRELPNGAQDRIADKALEMVAAYQKLYAELLKGIDDLDAGRVLTVDEAFAGLYERHGEEA